MGERTTNTMIMETGNEVCPLVSVVMCTYNTGEYIAEAVESILNQTYSNFEFIIWDDGSTDETRDVVESFKDERIKYYYHNNTGLGMALRLACKEAKGNYIARMDSDDVSLPERLETEVEFLKKHRDCVLVSSAVYYVDKVGKEMGRSYPYTDDKVLKRALMLSSSFICHPMVMMRRDGYESSGGYLQVMFCEDVLFWSRLAGQGRFCNIPTPLGKYRILSTSLDHAVNPYRVVLRSFLRKMVNDETVLETDIELYNKIYLYSKQFIQQGHTNINKKRKSAEERLFGVLNPVIGQHAAERVICKVKDIWFRMKFGILK